MVAKSRRQEKDTGSPLKVHWIRRFLKSDAFLISVAMVVLAVILVILA